jgi:hypothetical protein
VCTERCKHGSEGGCRKRAVRDTTRRKLLTGQRSKRHLAGILPYTWDLIPIDAAQTVIDRQGDGPLCLRAVGSTTYSYCPTGEAEDGLTPGLFAALPITGFALIQFEDGSVNEKAKQKILAGLETHGKRAVPFYESAR